MSYFKNKERKISIEFLSSVASQTAREVAVLVYEVNGKKIYMDIDGDWFTTDVHGYPDTQMDSAVFIRANKLTNQFLEEEMCINAGPDYYYYTDGKWLPIRTNFRN